MRYFAHFAAILLLWMAGFNAIGQAAQKFGHIDTQQLLLAMPERSGAEADLQTFAKQLETQLQTMNKELEEKYGNYVEKKDSMDDFIRQTREQEIADLQKRIQEFQISAQERLQKKEAELLEPLIAKARKAIKEVATEKGYAYVFDTSSGLLIEMPASDDLLPLVKEKVTTP